MTKSGISNTRIYNIWRSIKKRCYLPKAHGYEHYGAKGIKMCEEWLHDSVAFYNWALNNGYKDDLTIDRIDNSKGYSPDNCRWATIAEQNRHKGNNIFFTYKGITKHASAWADEYGMSVQCFLYRINHGWGIHDALTTPKNRGNGYIRGTHKR